MKSGRRTEIKEVRRTTRGVRGGWTMKNKIKKCGSGSIIKKKYRQNKVNNNFQSHRLPRKISDYKK